MVVTKLLHNHHHHHYTQLMDHPPPPPSPPQSPPPETESPPPLTAKCWLDDATITDINHFIKTLSGIKSKNVRPDLIGSIITHYACKWIPELSGDPPSPENNNHGRESATTSWLKKRFFIETIVAVLPPENDAVPCGFLLRLLKNANMVGSDLRHREEVEKRVAMRLEEATVKEIMIPYFSHTKGTLLDVELMIRLVKRFVEMSLEGLRTGAGLFKVAKLVDAYLAEAALDSELTLSEFMELAGAIPTQARVTDDGLYRAIDTYLKTHVNITKQERKTLCKLIDIQKLSLEASLHAAQNERLPVRSVIQMLFSEQTKPHSHVSWSRSFTNTKSSDIGSGPPGRCHSSRDIMTLQHMEMKQLKEHVGKLEKQCHMMQAQIEKMLEKKRGFFSWRKSVTSTALGALSVEVADSGSIGKQTPVKGKQGRSKNLKAWRQSSS